jgi:hypothetical protein
MWFSMEIDLHGYHPRDMVWSRVLNKVVQQAWEMGESSLCLIHGHGRNRGISPGFVNTNTGYFGLEIRRALRHDHELRKWILHTTLDCAYPGCMTVRLRPNKSPTRTMIDSDVLPNAVLKKRTFLRLSKDENFPVDWFALAGAAAAER